MSDSNRPLILVSNDDSYAAAGVHALISRLVRQADVVAVCPDAPRSGQSMAITVNCAMRATRCDDSSGAPVYMVNGTPTDCVKLAMHTLLPRRPDMVVAGINHGSNASVNVLYSGTMGAVMEGCVFGIPSVGFSLTSHAADADFTPCFPFIDEIVASVLRDGLEPGVCLNVNIPAGCTPTEMRCVRPARGKWSDEYEDYTDPHGRPFYWLKGKFENEEPEAEDTDEWCLGHGIVSVVPVEVDRTPVAAVARYAERFRLR